MDFKTDTGPVVKHASLSLVSILFVEAIYRYAAIWPNREGPSIDLHLRFVLPLLALAISTNILGWLRCRKVVQARINADSRGTLFWTATVGLVISIVLIGFRLFFLSQVWHMNGMRAAT
jgi:hypothetical protein